MTVRGTPLELLKSHSKPNGFSPPSHSPESPGARIRCIRMEQNLTIEDLAAAIGLSVTDLGYIERGRVLPSLSTLRKLAATLGSPIAYLGCFEKMPEETLGQRIEKARHYMGYTKAEFAAHLGVNVKTVYNWERSRTVPPGEHMGKIQSLINSFLK